MKIGAPCLLLVGSLHAFCEDGGATTGTASQAAPSSATSQELKSKLEWNVAPAHWEGLLGATADAANAVSMGSASGGIIASKFDFASLAGDSTGGMTESRLERVLRQPVPRDGLRLGQSDYVFRSPILEGLIPRPAPDGASLGEKLLNLPIVRWFRPLPMPEPPGGGKYFKWGERAESWRDYARPAPSPGATDNGK